MAKKKKQITIEQAVSDCRALFNIPESTHSKEEKGHFLIDKREFERFEPGFFAQGYDDQEEPPQLCYSNPAVIRQTIAIKILFIS